MEKVVVRWLEHSASMDGRPLAAMAPKARCDPLEVNRQAGRVQWTFGGGLAWSSVSPGWVADLKAGMDAKGHVLALHTARTHPTSRCAASWAILAGCLAVPRSENVGYRGMALRQDSARAQRIARHADLAAESAGGGLRGNIMRTPGQRQQVFALEGLIK